MDHGEESNHMSSRHLFNSLSFILTLLCLLLQQTSSRAGTLWSTGPDGSQLHFTDVFVESLKYEGTRKVITVRFDNGTRSVVPFERVTRIDFGNDENGRKGDIQVGTKRFHDTHPDIMLISFAKGAFTIVPQGSNQPRSHASHEIPSFSAPRPKAVVVTEDFAPGSRESISFSGDSSSSSRSISGPKTESRGTSVPMTLPVKLAVAVFLIYFGVYHLALAWCVIVEGQFFWFVILGLVMSFWPLRLFFLLFKYDGSHREYFLYGMAVELILGFVVGGLMVIFGS